MENDNKQTVTYYKEDIEKIITALVQIPVSGVQNVTNLAVVFEILDRKVILNK